MHPRKLAACFVGLFALVVVSDWVGAQAQQAPTTPGTTQPRGVGPGRQKVRKLVYATVPSENTDPGKGGYGSVSVVVFDSGMNWRFVKRIPLWDFPATTGPEYVKGISVSPVTQMLYVSTDYRMGAWNITTEKKVWEESWDGECCDRAAISHDGKVLYAPAYGKRDRWHVVDAMTGKRITQIMTPLSMPAHNTSFSLDGSKVYMAGSGRTSITIANAKTHTIEKTIEGFAGNVRVFAVKGDDSYFFSNLHDLIGFTVADVKAGKVIHPRVEVPGFSQWTRERLTGHGVPSHGIAMTPDEKELWVADGVNGYLHIFDITKIPALPTKTHSIKLRHQPYWITIGLDGKYAYPSSGDVIDVASKQIVGQLYDEYGKEFYSEKLVEVLVEDGKVTRAVDQFGMGQIRATETSVNRQNDGRQ